MAVKSRARLYAYQVLKKFEEGAPVLDPFLEKIYISDLPRRDQALTIELVRGVIRWLKKIDFILSFFSKKPIESLDSAIKTALRLGIYQIYFLTRIPPFAATNESVELIKKDLGLSGASFVNGVLRSIIRCQERVVFPDREENELRWLSIQFSHPEWMIKRWMERFGAKETEKILKENNDHPPVSLWINTRLFPVRSVIQKLKEEGVTMSPSPYMKNSFTIEGGSPFQVKAFKEGAFYVQDEASQLIPTLFGEKISGIGADLCSAPGGKGIKMVHDARNDLFVVATDISYSRLKILKENVDRMKIDHFAPILANMEEESPLKRRCDFVLVDAPCSGTGVIRRHPEIKWRLREEDMKEFHLRQLSLLGEATKIIKKGGKLLYSVCSMEVEENEQTVRSFLHSHRRFCLEDIRRDIPQKVCKFIDKEGFFRTYPHRDRMDGFFAALFRRVS